jgi:hypothetical protein
MEDRDLKEFEHSFETGLLRLIDRDQRLEIHRGCINGKRASPAIYEATRQRLLELAGLQVGQHTSRRGDGEIHLKISEAERLFRVARDEDGAIQVETAIDVVMPADVNLQKAVAAASCPNIFIEVIDVIIDVIIVIFCCGGHCSRGAYTIPCEPGGIA